MKTTQPSLPETAEAPLYVPPHVKSKAAYAKVQREVPQPVTGKEMPVYTAENLSQT
jgi:hypothetical protein